MPDRIVVYLAQHTKTPPPAGAESFFSQARELLLRAKAFGATLCTWSWDAISFSFQVDDLEEAIGFVTGPDSRDLLQRLTVGISQGAIERLAGEGEVELGWGPALQRAMLISLLGKSGEVLVDCEMLAVHHVQLVTRGTRSTLSAPRLRAYLISAQDPFRAEAERTVERLVEPPLLGREDAIDRLVVVPGTLATVRAPAGFGGTRLLQALAQREKGAVAVLMQPVGHGMEPLGTLRRAFARASATGHAPPLAGEHQATWKSLAGGGGAAPDAVADFLEAWLASGNDKGGLLLLDDANEIDSATLDVVATALLGAQSPFRVVARLDRDAPLPAELAPLPPGPDVDLLALSEDQARAFVKACTGSVMRDEEADVWAERGGRIPLAIGEALAEGLSAGELAWSDAGARPRSIPPRAPTPTSAAGFVLRRMRFLAPSARAVLHALAVLGGDAPVRSVAALLEAAADIPVDLVLERERLTKGGWLRRPEPDWIALPSRTHLRMLVQSVPETRRAAWHRAASNHIEAAGSLELADAAWHAAAANDRGRAQRLAQRAASLAQEAGLDSAARELFAFARAHDPAPRPRIESDTSGLVPRPPMASSPGDPEDVFPVALAARGPKRPSRFTFPPVEVPEGELLSEPPSFPPDRTDSDEPPSLDDSDLLPDSSDLADAPGPGGTSEPGTDHQDPIPRPPRVPRVKAPAPRPTPPGTVRRPKLELLFEDEEASSTTGRSVGDPVPVLPQLPDEEDEPPTVRQPPPVRPPLGSIHELTEDDAIELMAPSLPEARAPTPIPVEETPDSERTIVDEGAGAERSAAPRSDIVDLLRSGDPERIVAWAQKAAEQEPVRARLAQRVRALAELHQGNRADAVRVLRVACEQARNMTAVEQSRSRLAFALGLASAGRSLEALLEGLEALSRAREAGDRLAERACVAFLRQLYEEQGQQSAAAWQPRTG